MKKFLAMILTLCMVCSLLPMAVMAENALPDEEFLLEDVLPGFEEELIVEEPLPEPEEPFAFPAEELPEAVQVIASTPEPTLRVPLEFTVTATVLR